MKIGTVTIEGARGMAAGPRFLTTMQIPILAGREIDDRDQPGSTTGCSDQRAVGADLLRERESAGPAHHASRTRSAISKSSACRPTCGPVV